MTPNPDATASKLNIAGTKIKPELILAEWLNRLEDPNTVQGFNRLRIVDPGEAGCTYCAMGHLADILVANGLGTWSGGRYEFDGYQYVASIPTDLLADVLDISEEEADVLQDTVVNLNDDGQKFADIAKDIREILADDL
jgi:hypothetical protein